MTIVRKTKMALCISVALLACGTSVAQAASNIETYAAPFALKGEKTGDYFGMTMTNIGKFSDKDNAATKHIAGEDIVISSPWADAQKGVAYVIFGTSGGKAMQQVNNVGEFDPQNALKIFHSNSKNLSGSVTTKWMGSAVRKIGDLNGDGYDDLVIASHWNDQVYVIWGGPHHRTGMARMSNQIDLNDIDNGDNSRGIRIRTLTKVGGGANTGGWFGTSIGPISYKNRGAGEKGIVDLAIGDIEGTAGRGGAVVIYGANKAAGEWQNIDLARDKLGNWDVPATTGAYIRPEIKAGNAQHPLNENLGQQISNVGDINGDGVMDYLIVDPQSRNEGRKSANSGSEGRGTAYLVYGSSFNRGNLLDISTLNDSEATRIHGMGAAFLGGQTGGSGGMNGANDHSGYQEDKDNNGTVAALGNFIPGINSFAISAPADKGIGNKRSGLVWVLKGKSSDYPAKLAPSLFLDAAYDKVGYNKSFRSTDGYAIYSNRAGTGATNTLGGFGHSILGNVDLNGDGKMDLVIGDPNAVNSSGIQTGAVYVVDGGTNFNNYVDEDGMVSIQDLVDGKVAYTIWGKNLNEKFGASIAAGNFNGNGKKVDSLAIGSYRDNKMTGKVTFRMSDYVIPSKN
ncbi:integrin alpha [Serratia proteamaculans]|uniref:FG-GAP repeat protein n=1 Tax=Serratia proteamaculans TaxID=28151 RepID=A0A5Q2VDA3_SERPR|nr:integrin alpha [Serratia proteamaculans]QGH61985.1 hypothetical protein GHV41_14635 [Serratia proteamaculans]